MELKEDRLTPELLEKCKRQAEAMLERQAFKTILAYIAYNVEKVVKEGKEPKDMKLAQWTFEALLIHQLQESKDGTILQ